MITTLPFNGKGTELGLHIYFAVVSIKIKEF